MFRNYILQNFPFLEDDFDALTDYQLFCKFLGYVKVFAKDNKEFKERLDKYENYFNNLDVQDEVNKKLDEMATSGELEELIAVYLNIITNITFDDVSSMKEATNLVNGNFVKTLGFYELGDGGSAYYNIRNLTNEDTIDEHFLISLDDDNLVAEFTMIGKDLHSRQIGLKGDDTTDETTLLQKFFDYENNYVINKIIDEGIYLISNTINIVGRVEQAGEDGQGYQNGEYKIKFDNASIHCNNDELAYCVKVYKFTEGVIEGLSITKSTYYNCKVLFSACKRTEIKNFWFRNIEINTNPSLISEVLTSYSTYHVRFSNGFIRGQVIIDPYNEDTHYINGVYFEYVNIMAFGQDSNIILKKSFSKHQIVFTNCDISGSDVSHFDVQEKQVNPYESDGIGSCQIVAVNCYFDGATTMFKNNNHNNVNYAEFGCRHSGTAIENYPYSMEDFLTTTMLGVSSHNVKPILPISNLNIIKNGDMTSHTYSVNDSSKLFGIDDTNTTKEYVANYYQKNGYVRRVTFNNTSNVSLSIDGERFLYDAVAVAGLIFEVVSGGCDIQIVVSGKYGKKIVKSEIKDGINIITTNQNNTVFEQGSYGWMRLEFSNIEADTVIDFYEIGLQMGLLYIPNAQLLKSAIPS